MNATPTARIPLPAPANRARRTPLVPTCTALMHGTYTAADKWRCSCPDAVEALRKYRKRQKHGTLPDSRPIDATGTRRRLQALAAIGYSAPMLATYLDVSKQLVHQLTTTRTRVNRATAARIAALYGPLSALPPQFNPAIPAARRVCIDRVVTTAREHGWLPPIVWDEVDIDDPAAVPDTTGVLRPGRHAGTTADDVLELVVDGAPVSRVRALWAELPGPARATVVATLSAPGAHGDGRIALELSQLFGTTMRTIMRHRQSARAAAARTEQTPALAVA